MQIKYIRSIKTTPQKYKTILSAAVWSLAILCAITFSSEWAEHIKNGISLCLSTVIPSVFPFMLISSLITSFGADRDLGAVFSFPSKLLFGTTKSAACPVFIGMICGYPTGTLTAASMYDSGELSKSEVERILTFINIPSAAFVIVAVGEKILGSKNLGIAIYLSVLISAVLVGMICRIFSKSSPQKKSTANHISTPPFPQAITEAIKRSAQNMFNVSACVITFSSLSGALCSFPLICNAPDWIKAVLSGIFEVSSGARATGRTPSSISPFLAASICAWSGISVHIQIISACRGRGISFFPFFISKAAQAVLAPIILGIYLHIFG